MNGEKLDAQRLVIGEGFAWESIPDGCLLYEERTGKLITMNPIAEAVLTHCDGELTGAEIGQILERDFEIPPAETRRLLAQLHAEGVIGTLS